MFSINSKGSFKNTEDFLNKLTKTDVMKILEANAQEGVNALIAGTPYDSGIAAHSWGYKVERSGKSYSITWTNTDVENGFPVAIMLQYGYATGTGGYVHGRDYINPALKPVFDKIAEDVWKAVTSA